MSSPASSLKASARSASKPKAGSNLKAQILVPLVVVALSVYSALRSAPSPDPLVVARRNCPDILTYLKEPHAPYSDGPLELPSMRLAEECRTFTSQAVEELVDDFGTRMKDKDLAMLFSNAVTNTLDTTIKWRNENLTFVVTGDITAFWLRDSCNQLAIYQSLAPRDPALAEMIRGAIALQAEYITAFPYCGAFQPPAISKLKPTVNEWAQGISHPFPIDNQTVFECKYELDSLAGFLRLSRQYIEANDDPSVFTPSWFTTFETIFDLIRNQSLSTLDENDQYQRSYAFLQAFPQIPIPNQGVGAPVRATGLVKTAFRPSDDAVIFQFHIADNALLVVELREIAALLRKYNLRSDLASHAAATAETIEAAIYKHGVVEREGWGKVFAYEVDGFGGRVFMDDANVPSLLSLPHLGFVKTSDPIWQNTKRMLLSSEGNPYFAKGKAFWGIGGPHEEGLLHPWPMALSSIILTSTSDTEILDTLEWLKNSTSGLGLIHESINVHDTENFTRPWFGWANSYFAEAVLKVAAERPHLLF